MFHKAAYARSGGMYNDLFIANFRANLPVKMENRLGFDRIMATSLWSYFLVHHVFSKTIKKLKTA